MSFKLVNALRKEGHLEEAYEIAKEDFAEENSKWSRSALFWVLRDKINAAFEQGDNDACGAHLSEMKEVFEGMEDIDGIAGGAIEKIGWNIYRSLKSNHEAMGSSTSRRILLNYIQLCNPRPSLLHSQMLNMASKISEKYPDFNFLKFLKLWGPENFRDEDLKKGEINGKELLPLHMRIFQRCISLGYNLTECIDTFCLNPNISREELMTFYSRQKYFDIFNLSKQSPADALSATAEYFKSNAVAPLSNEFNSKILSSFIYLSGNQTPSETKCILEAFGFESFTPEDWKRDKGEKRDFPSLVEKFIKKYEDSIDSNPNHNPSNKFEPLLQKAIGKYPNNNELLRYLAKAYIAWGERDKALDTYRKILKISPEKYYLWDELASLAEDRGLRLSALCKAILSQPKDEFLVNVRLHLAGTLIDEGLFSEAAAELNRYANTCKRNSWPIKQACFALQYRIPEGTMATCNNFEFYRTHLAAAEAFVFSDIPWTTMVVASLLEFPGKDGKQTGKVKLLSASGEKMLVRAKQFKGIGNVEIGSCFDVKIQKDGNKCNAVLIRKSDASQEAYMTRDFEGVLRIKIGKVGNKFSFIDNVYIHERLLKGFENGDYAEGKAVKSQSKWRALILRKSLT